MSRKMSIKKRLKGPTPPFFKRVLKIGLSMVAAGGAILGAEAAIPGFHLPEVIKHLAQWFVAGGLAASAVAKTTVNE